MFHQLIIPTPEVKDKQWSTHWIDPFALAAIEKRNLRPAKEADPVTLVRRLHFDLTGLPPAPEVVQSFASDPSEQAYSRIIEDILDSPPLWRTPRHLLAGPRALCGHRRVPRRSTP